MTNVKASEPTGAVDEGLLRDVDALCQTVALIGAFDWDKAREAAAGPTKAEAFTILDRLHHVVRLKRWDDLERDISVHLHDVTGGRADESCQSEIWLDGDPYRCNRPRPCPLHGAPCEHGENEKTGAYDDGFRRGLEVAKSKDRPRTLALIAQYVREEISTGKLAEMLEMGADALRELRDAVQGPHAPMIPEATLAYAQRIQSDDAPSGERGLRPETRARVERSGGPVNSGLGVAHPIGYVSDGWYEDLAGIFGHTRLWSRPFKDQHTHAVYLRPPSDVDMDTEQGQQSSGGVLTKGPEMQAALATGMERIRATIARFEGKSAPTAELMACEIHRLMDQT